MRIAATAVMPRKTPVAVTEQTAAYPWAPHAERNPLVTLRKITDGRKRCSDTLLVGGTSRRVTKTNSLSRHFSMLAPFHRIGLNRQQATEAAIQAAPAGQKRAVRQTLAPAADDERPPQEKLEARRKQFIPGVNCVPGVAQQMGEAHLMRLCVAHLRPQPVADPDFRRCALEKISRHRRAAADCDAVRHRRGGAEHPLPAGLPLDTR